MTIEIKTGFSLAKLTSLAVGGAAKYLVEPSSSRDIFDAVGFAQAKDMTLVCLGGGTNTLCHDRGFSGLILRLGKRYSKIVVEEDHVVVQGGCPLPKLVQHCCREKLADLSSLAGIPGNVAGAVFMNAGTARGSIGDKVEWVEVVDPETCDLSRLDLPELQFDYRSSALQKTNQIVTRVATKREEAGNDDWLREMKQQIRHRRDSQPKDKHSAGSFFRNPPGEDAGLLIDKCGFKGTRIGGAIVSPVHAGWLINQGDATAEDFTRLIQRVRNRVHEECGVKLKLEIRLLGFTEAERQELHD